MPWKDLAARKAYQKAYDKKRPRRTDPAYIASLRRGRKKAEVKQRKALWDYKAEKGCTDCGNSDYRVLEFDHRDRAHKEFCIADFVGRLSWEKIMREVEKCDVRCANCHRIKTWNEDKALRA